MALWDSNYVFTKVKFGRSVFKCYKQPLNHVTILSTTNKF